MSGLRRVVAAPFLERDTDEVTRAEFVYTLTGDTGWFTPDEAEDILERAVSEGLLEEDEGDGEGLSPRFDTDGVEAPRERPETDLRNGGVKGTNDTFERVVGMLVDSGYGRREAVAEINRRHARMGDARVEAAALLVARYEGLDASSVAEIAEDELGEMRG